MAERDPRRIAITGCAGFIGSRTADLALSRGWDVVGVDSITDYYDTSLKQGNLYQLKTRWGQDRFQAIQRDILDLTEHELQGVSAIVHCAGQPGVRSSWSEFDSYVRLNILATNHLLDLVRKSNVGRVVYSSSSSIYGNASSYPVNEDHPTNPVSPYGVSKLAAEQLCGAYAETFGVPVVSLRYFTVYGPGQRPDMAILRMIKACETSAEFTVFGDGSHIRDFTFVDDVARANLAAIESSKVLPGDVFNVCGGSSISVKELIAIVEESCDKRLPLRHAPEQPGDVRQTGGSNSLAREKLDWQPRIAIREGVKREVEWFRSLGIGAM